MIEKSAADCGMQDVFFAMACKEKLLYTKADNKMLYIHRLSPNAPLSIYLTLFFPFNLLIVFKNKSSDP